MKVLEAVALAALTACGVSVNGEPAFVNGLVIAGVTLDAAGGTTVNDGRLGFFSDISYDAARGERWALSDRCPATRPRAP